MTLRQRIEQIGTELDEDLFLAGAPISTVAGMLRAALAQDASRVFTTVEELDSEEVSKVLRPDQSAPDATAPAKVPDFVTPCHGERLWISTRSEGCFGGYESTEVVDEITCGAPGCLNTWDPDGTLTYQTPALD